MLCEGILQCGIWIQLRQAVSMPECAGIWSAVVQTTAEADTADLS